MSRSSSAGSHTNGKPAEWAERQVYWRRRLGRLRLGVEPIEQQLHRYLGVTWALTIVPAVSAAIILGLFTAFGAWQIGVGVAGIIFLPVIAVAWLDYWRIRRGAAEYERERQDFEGAALSQGTPEAETSGES